MSYLHCRIHKSVIIWIVAVAAVVVAASVGMSSAALAAPVEGDGWLNIRDCGASGSSFETTAITTAGSHEITVKDVGDFKVGQGVMISKCNPQIVDDKLWGPGNQYAPGSGKPLKDVIDIRGYDESAGSWTVYILDVEPSATPSFRWSDDIARTWKPKVPITYDWQPLHGGMEVRFHKFAWDKGYTATFSARDQLVSTITKINGNVLTLQNATPRAVKDAVVRHRDDDALQAAIDLGLKEKRNVFLPAGRYRLTKGLKIQNPSGITIEGVNGEDSVLDISEGTGACITMRYGTEVSIRNLRMVGNSGFAERDQAGHFPTWGCKGIWGQDLKTCFATAVIGTERVLVENVHASRMSLECFWSGGPSRHGTVEPKQYTKAITYQSCWAIDCARNGFNNNDMAENTSILNCRIVDVGGCAWEGASRFVKFIGNYVRNAGTVAMGNIRSRAESFEILPSGQHIVADNVFESVVPYGGCAIRAAASATPVVIANNIFVNFGSSAIELSGSTGPQDLPACNGTITGNVFDMTEIGPKSTARCAINVSENDAIVSNNQIYVRGDCDPNVTGIQIREPAMNINVHDNLISNCGTGIATNRAYSRVGQVIDPHTFVPGSGYVPLERRRSHRYSGWNLVWTSGDKTVATSVIQSFDPDTERFMLQAPHEMKPGDSFEVFPPYGANWSLHDNTVTGCVHPVVLDSYGSETSDFDNNIVTRGGTTGVAQAVVVGGRFNLIGNHFADFDEPNSVVLSLPPDRLGRKLHNVYRDNFFERCTAPVDPSGKAAWDASINSGNQFIHCGADLKAADIHPPVSTGAAAPPAKPVLHAPKLAAAVTVDGDVKEWPWQNPQRTVTLAVGPSGEAVSAPKATACAGWSGDNLYLAIRIPVPPTDKLTPGLNWQGDGVEVSFRGEDPQRTPVFLLWGTTDSTFNSSSTGGASAAQVQLLEKSTAYAARVTPGEWTCEWRIPLGALGLNPAKTKVLLFNLGVHSKSEDSWIAWVPTGAEICRVDNAGELHLEQ